MQWLCLLRLFGLCTFSTIAAGAPHQLRASASLLSVSRQRGDSGDSGGSKVWDYHDEGKSWTSGICPNGDTDFSQSPVNISTTVAAAAPDDDYFFFRYPTYEEPVTMKNDGRFLQAVISNDDGKVGGFAFGTSYPNHLTVEYSLYKIAIHTPSEHTYNGVKVPLEVQLFHRKTEASLTDGEPDPADMAIVAAGFAESRDEASPFLRALKDGGLPDQKGGTSTENRGHPESFLEFSDIFKPVFGGEGEKAGFWDYTGSLTQPPCSSGVRWLIRQQAMNAKADTLKYFTDAAKKSSGGVPGNARALQIIGPRPVFPRFARDAVHMMVFQPEEPAAFKDAFSRAKSHQRDFKKALKGDAEGTKAAMKQQKSAREVVLASNEYKRCMNDMGVTVERLTQAQLKQTDECNKMKGAEETIKQLTGGPARIEAGVRRASLAKGCEDQGNVVSALEAQQGAQQAQCDAYKRKIKRKYEKAMKAEQAKKAAEDAKKNSK